MNTIETITAPILCSAGCGEDVTAHGLRIRDGRYCDLCAGELALDILDSPLSSEEICEQAKDVLETIDLRRAIAIRNRRREAGRVKA